MMEELSELQAELVFDVEQLETVKSKLEQAKKWERRGDLQGRFRFS